tara:strand:+ start:2576 stop:3049 length:474 start_codon:yes stop_codon:yes gene_type:complete
MNKILRKTKKKAQKKKKKQKDESDIQQVVNHYFSTKGLSLDQVKKDAKKKKILYSRYVRPGRDLLVLAGSVAKAKKAIDRVAEWAQSRGLDYTIETVFKRWLELDRLKPKEVVKKPFYQENPMVWSATKRKWFVVTPEGEWLEFAAEEKDIEWRIVE